MATTMPTKAEVLAGLRAVVAVAETIRELRTVPSGVLYAQLMGMVPCLTLASYDKLIETLVNAGLVSVSNHVLTWTGPELGTEVS